MNWYSPGCTKDFVWFISPQIKKDYLEYCLGYILVKIHKNFSFTMLLLAAQLLNKQYGYMIPNSDNSERCRQVSDSIHFTLVSHHIMFYLQCDFQGHAADLSSPSSFLFVLFA